MDWPCLFLTDTSKKYSTDPEPQSSSSEPTSMRTSSTPRLNNLHREHWGTNPKVESSSCNCLQARNMYTHVAHGIAIQQTAPGTSCRAWAHECVHARLKVLLLVRGNIADNPRPQTNWRRVIKPIEDETSIRAWYSTSGIQESDPCLEDKSKIAQGVQHCVTNLLACLEYCQHSWV